jgi:predicted outer membrane protein
MKNLMNFALMAYSILAVQACSLPKYDAGTYVPGGNQAGVSASSSDAANVRPTDGTTRTGATPTGANSGTSPFSAGMPSMGTANSTSSGISGDALAAEESKRLSTGFIRQAASGGSTMITISQLATKNASRENVKALAGALVTDAQKAYDELRTIAEAKDISLPQPDQSILKKLSAIPAKDFDSRYLEMLSLEHQKIISLFRDAMQYPDPVIKAYAVKNLPSMKIKQKEISATSRQISREK